jgi:uncharacterized membrane protein (DUF106 family)
MSEILARVMEALNGVANALGRVLLAPVAVLPGWLSATLVAAVTGVILLIIFKYTSNQAAIKRARNDIDANLFAIKLFKDATPVVLAAQGALMMDAYRLFALAIVPMLVMMIPVLLILGQLSLWYQHRPLRVGEEAVMVLKANDAGGVLLKQVELESTPAAEVVTGPVRVPSRHEVVWLVRANQAGSHRLSFRAGEQSATKEFEVGDGFMRVSPRRPARDWYDQLIHPAEPAFGVSSTIQSIEIAYPDRPGITSGTNTWVFYWFVASMIAAFLAKPFLGVNL